MRRVGVWLAVVVAVLAGGVGVAEASSAKGAKHAAKVRCHWVKATKKHRRHRVCVKVKPSPKPMAAAKAKAKAKANAKAKAAPKPAAHAPVAGSPATSSPAAAPTLGAAPTPTATPPGALVFTTPITDPPPTTDAPPPPPVAARLQTTAREFSLQLSRPAIVAGPLILELVNRGEDPHDLHVRPAAGGADVLALAQTAPSGVKDATGTLAAGTYTLYCSLPGHEAAGMHATLVVQ
jgi:hypothetical protein